MTLTYIVSILGCFIFALALPGSSKAAPADQIIFDFESGDLQGWQVVEGKFDRLICDSKTGFSKPGLKCNNQGNYYLSTLALPDGGVGMEMMGMVESPVFVLTGPEISFLIGGALRWNTYVALCTLDGREVMRAHGKDWDALQRMDWGPSGKSLHFYLDRDDCPAFQRVNWDASSLVGEKVYLRIVDESDGQVGGGPAWTTPFLRSPDVNKEHWGYVVFDDCTVSGKIDSEATANLKTTLPERRKALAAQRVEEQTARREAFFAEERLFARGESRIYRGETLGGISLPTGGIGSGSIQMDGGARRPIWQAFGNYNQIEIPNSFFAVRARTEGDDAIVRALQTSPAGPFPAMKDLTFKGEYPFGWYDFQDPQMPVQVSLETFNPLIPLDEKNSAIPCAIYSFTAKNQSGKRVQVSFLATQQNAVGYSQHVDLVGRSHEHYKGNINEVLREPGATILHMTTNGHSPEAGGFGDMALVALADAVEASAEWSDLEQLADDFADDGGLTGVQKAGPSPAGQTIDGALAASFELKPGEEQTVTFVLTWYFPNAMLGEGKGGVFGDAGHMYCNWWPNALGVTRYMVSRLSELTRSTRLYHDTLYDSNLPYWLLDRLSSQVDPIRSQTCFWAKNGFFGAYEGCNSTSGSGPGNCNHLYHYAQAHARLFPEIARRMREQQFHILWPDGGVQNRIVGEDWLKSIAAYAYAAIDGQCGDILGCYREHLMSADRKWLDDNWPSIKKMMNYAIATWDTNEDGVPAGAQFNTLDVYVVGSSSWLGGLYLAALAATEKMAEVEGEVQTAARYRRIRELGTKKQGETLFNGDYFIQNYMETPETVDEDQQKAEIGDTGCLTDQLLGQWWAHQLDLGWIYEPDHVRKALMSVLKHNFRTDFHGVKQQPRKYVEDDGAGMQLLTWPKGGRPENAIWYSSEVWTGLEYATAATMIQSGLLKEGLAVVRTAYDRYDGRLRTALGAGWGDYANWTYSGNPFSDDECGKFYGRALSVWSLLLALQGFVYDGPAATIGFKPVWQPEDHRSFFTAAEGWGLFTQKRARGEQSERIEVRMGRLRVRTLVFELDEGARPAQIVVKAAGKTVPHSHAFDRGLVTISLRSEALMETGEALEIRMASE